MRPIGLILLALAAPLHAAVLLDDAWPDATRDDTALPAEAAWYSSNAASLLCTAGALTGTTASGSSRSWWTYFTAATPVTLTEGETLRVTLRFAPNGVNPSNSSRSLRIGLFDFSGGARTPADGSSPAGSGVTGYALNMNIGQTFGVTGPISIRERTTVSSSDLMGSAGDFTTLGTDGGGANGSPGFLNSALHTLEFSVTRTAAGADITATFSRGDGWSITHTASDATPVVTFDGFALRPANSAQTAAEFVFSLIKVEKLNAVPPGPPVIQTPPESQTLPAGDGVTFTASASGPQPITWQWRRNGSDIPGATRATLSLTNVQSPGSYTAVATNAYGFAETTAAALTVTPQAPVFTQHPLGTQAIAGEGYTFTAAARGTEPMTWQWTKDGDPISGATSSSLMLFGLTTAAAGTYRVTATSSAGSAQSDPAVLTVVNFTAPPGIYVAPGGITSAPGSNTQPTTLASAITRVAPGGIIWMRGGTYTHNAQITIARGINGGGEALRKRIHAFVLPDGSEEVPVLDFSSQPYGSTSSASNPRGLMLGGDWWHVRGLEIKGAADNGLYVGGNHNIIERCRTHLCRDSGLQISRFSSSDGPVLWPSFNLVLNCESWDNHDGPPNAGENADGFACKLTSGAGNVFRGCVAHHNIDDGWDLFTKTDTGPIGSVVIDRCIAHSNGVLTDGTSNENGDRNGFKLGGEGIPVVHTVTRSLAFGNGKNGFTWNSNPGAMLIMNNLAFDNAEANFQFTAAGPFFYNNCSLYTTGTGVNDRYGGASGAPTGLTNCFWLTGSSSRGPSINDAGIVINAASFLSLTPPSNSFNRRSDGSLDFGNFARPVAGQRLINGGALPAGVTLPFDAAYYNSAPDIGLVETRTGFDLWREQQFGEDSLTLPHTAADFSAAGDGHANILRYLLGLSATAPVPDSLLPSLVPMNGGFRYRWQRATTAADVTAAPFSSTDLNSWSGLTPAMLGIADGMQTWEAAAPTGARRFFRLHLLP